MDDIPEHLNESKTRRKWRRRVGLMGIPVLALGLLAAACGGAGTSPGVAKGQSTSTTTASSSSKSSTYQRALAFTACMRSHGEPAFPDPSPSGGFNITISPNDPQLHAAEQACSSLLPNGGNQTTGGNFTPSEVAQLLSYAKCMRSQGVLNFPDPTSKGLGALNGIDPNSPQFNAASHACQSLLPSAGGSGPVTRPGGGS